jgi:hypothetical protein
MPYFLGMHLSFMKKYFLMKIPMEVNVKYIVPKDNRKKAE